MLKIKNFFLIIGLFTFVTSCGVGKALAPQKKSGSEEFLVKKKSPLVMPPSYGELPAPSEKNVKETREINDIKKILTGNKNKTSDTKSNSKIESLILKEINNKD